MFSAILRRWRDPGFRVVVFWWSLFLGSMGLGVYGLWAEGKL